MCDTRTLARKDQAHIGHCIHCKAVYLWHGNLLLHFSSDEFVRFSNALHRHEFCEFAMPFPDEEERVILHSPCQDISFTFTKTEWINLKSTVDEAVMMQQVYALI